MAGKLLEKCKINLLDNQLSLVSNGQRIFIYLWIDFNAWFFNQS